MENTECCGYLNDHLLNTTDSSESGCNQFAKGRCQTTDCGILLYVQKQLGLGVPKLGKKRLEIRGIHKKQTTSWWFQPM